MHSLLFPGIFLQILFKAQNLRSNVSTRGRTVQPMLVSNLIALLTRLTSSTRLKRKILVVIMLTLFPSCLMMVMFASCLLTMNTLATQESSVMEMFGF